MLCVLYASGVAVVTHSFIAVSGQALAPRGHKLSSLVHTQLLEPGQQVFS